MRIKRFTPTLLSLFNVRSGDEGRPIADIVSQLARDGLERDARQVIRTLVPVEREVAVVEGDRSYQMTMRPYRDTNNVINGVVITFVDISERKQAEASRARLAAIVDSTDDAILAKDLNGVITSWNRSAEHLFGYSSEEAVGQPVTMLIPPDRLDEEEVIQTRLRKGEAVDHLETVRRRKDGGLIEVSLTVSPIKASDGSIIGASKIARDITQQKRDQKQAALLLAELDHRVKNILAVVSSVVTQTVKSAETPQDLATSIEGRIAAIAKAHSLLTNGGTAGASLAALFHTELAPHRRADRVSVSGPDINLTPRAGMALSLTIHELTTNAVKYGALSSAAGRLDVHWDVTGGGGGVPVLRIDWTEANGPPVSPPSRNGFGAILIERALTHEFDARVKREFQPSGLVCRIEMALTDEVSHAVVAEGGSNP